MCRIENKGWSPQGASLFAFWEFGRHWINTFQFAHACGEGMKHYANMLQESGFAAREKGYTFVSHQLAPAGSWRELL